MTSILFLIGRIYRKKFKFNYLKTQNKFLNFLLHFLNVHQILNFLIKIWLS